MRIDIQKDLKEKEKYRKNAKRSYVIYMAVGNVSLAIVIASLYGLYKAMEIIIPKATIDTGGFVGVIGLLFFIYIFGLLACACFRCLPDIKNDCVWYDGYIEWLNDHKEYDYAMGEVWQSLNDCTFIKKGEKNGITE